MSKQVLDISQMQHLKELGVDTSKASACWFRVLGVGDLRVSTIWSLSFNKYITKPEGIDTQIVPTFTLQDILDLLPKSIEYYGQLQIHFCEMTEGMYANQVVYSTIEGNQIVFFDKDVIDSAYEMLCWCMENGFTKTNKED